MKKFYDIQLGGKKMTDQQFENLADNVLVGGTSHRYNAKRIEYDGNYSNARTDMRAAEQWLKAQGYKPIKKRIDGGDYYLDTENDDYHFYMIWGTYVTI